MFMMVTKVFLFTFSGVFNRQRIHNLFKNQMITNHAIQLNVCNSQCSHGTWTCFHFWNAPMGPGPAFTFAMLPWDLAFTRTPMGPAFTFTMLPWDPHHRWLSLFKCVLTRHGERIGYLCHRCLTQLNLRVKNRKHMKWNDMIFIFKNTQDCFLTMCNVKTRRKQSQTKTVF